MTSRTKLLIGIAALFIAIGGPATAVSQADAAKSAPWLDVPASWSRKVENNVVALTPGDLPPGSSLLLLVELPTKSKESLAEAYDRALKDLGPWRPVGDPVEQSFPTGWTFRLGVGVSTLQGKSYTAQTAVARRGDLCVRFWAFADSDGTFNRYKDALGIAIASAQDITSPPIQAATPAGPALPVGAEPDPAFGKGISGVYAGIERGAIALPQGQSHISDFMEVDVFYPDGAYRRRLPVRGLASDRGWDQQQQPVLWGTWRREGNQVVVRRGSYTTSYTIQDERTLISDRGRPWAKVDPRSGARLDGVYARGDYRDADAPRLLLRADGTYEDRGDFLRMIGSAWNLVVPDGNTMVARWSDAEAKRAMGAGSGTYTLSAFALTLHDRDGRLWQINAYVPPGEALPMAGRLVLNGRLLVRD